MSMNLLHIVTVGTDISGYYNILMDSCNRLKLNIVNIGLNKKWTGFTMRFSLLYEYLQQLKDNDIILFTDAYDVIFLENEKDILNKFYQFNKPIVFGDQSGPLSDYTMLTCNQHHLCGGSYIGYVKYIKQLLNIIYNPDIYETFHNDDQLVLNYICQNHSFFDKYVSVDTNHDIFYITNVDTYININYWTHNNIGLTMNNGLLLKSDNKQPSVLHLAAQVNGDKYIQYLNYDINKIVPINSEYRIKQVFHICISLIKRKLWIHIFIILIIVILISYFSFYKSNP